jgi:hypothetical protein
MTDAAGHKPKVAKPARRGASLGLIFALGALVAVILLAAGFVALMLWPRWPGATVAPDAPALAGDGRRRAVQRAARRHPDADPAPPRRARRLDLAFLWPSLMPPDPAARPAPRDSVPPIDRLFMTIDRSPPRSRRTTACARSIRAISPTRNMTGRTA